MKVSQVEVVELRSPEATYYPLQDAWLTPTGPHPSRKYEHEMHEELNNCGITVTIIIGV